ncbi:MAG: hypothetical protein A2428_01700 [Bdellovibrionales bacterium RIFOXYC1_FULL_54_43]|nr:MAG: hypothetical protein A2428_01700 [Bdellovibrionales bacterium RIFOXYC1_FULL_54_43]OFZ83652.1 MAG: hypothetical protein A2603_16500 [Bdellovibrionales bacterium RIFOXYD1_FULL_55_31]
MERRRPDLLKSSPLPVDYLRMVSEVFTANFDSPLKKLKKLAGAMPAFSGHGEIFSQEIVLAVSLSIKGHLAATTVYASVDFDPKASSPTVEELLSGCVDAIGTVFSQLLLEDRLKPLLEEPLSALENVPFEWTALEVERRQVYIKLDRANLDLERLTDDWLAKHDPEFKKNRKLEEEAAKELFVTGPKRKG